MKQRWFIFLALGLSLWSFAASAQNSPETDQVYKVGDVPVDVTAASAVKARDQAIADAQRSAFSLLLGRLGADTGLGAKLSNDDLAALVKNFEVSNEKSSSVRYIGTFSVQFRPNAVRNFLADRHAAFNDTPGEPVLVIPVTRNGYQVLLWGDKTPWFKAWEAAAMEGGMVPIIIPEGKPEDQNAVTAQNLIDGKVEAIKTLIDEYQTDGAVVVVLDGSIDQPAAGFTIDVQRFGTGFDAGSAVEHIKVAGTNDRNALDGLLTKNIKEIQKTIEKKQYDDKKHTTDLAAAETDPSSGPVTVWNDVKPLAHIRVTVQFATLAEWADIQRRLLATPGVQSVDISSVRRGVTEIELGFTGTPNDISTAAAQHGLRLKQDILSGKWMLQGW